MLMDLSFSPLIAAIDKQKTLLSADVGHFSLVRAMHLADLITLMNGGFPPYPLFLWRLLTGETVQDGLTMHVILA